MDYGSLLLILSLIVLVAWFIGRPLFDQRATSVSAAEQARSALLAERERVLDSLQELDFDYKLGKIPESDYPRERTRLLERGAEILKGLDDLDIKVAAQRPRVSDAIEKAIADRRTSAGAGPRQPVAADDEIERLVAARRREKTDRYAGFCPQCGQAIQQSDKFCSKCGSTL